MDVECIEHGRTLVLEVMVCRDGSAGARLYLGTTRSNDPGGGHGALEHDTNSLNFSKVKPVGKKNGDASAFNSWGLWSVEKLRKRWGPSSVVLLPRFFGNFAVNFRSDLSRDVGVHIVENLRVCAINDRIVAMSKLKSQGRNDVFLLIALWIVFR